MSLSIDSFSQTESSLKEEKPKIVTQFGIFENKKLHKSSDVDRYIIKPDAEGILDFDSALADNLQNIIDIIHEDYEVPALSVGFYVPGKGLWLGATGYSSNPTDTINQNTIFNIASITKPYISAMILMMEEEGKLALDDSIGTYLLNLPENIPGEITIRQLLNMRSGLSDYTWDHLYDDLNRKWTTDDLLALVGPPKSPPGVSFQYCGISAVLAGLIIKTISQTNISTQLKQRIFEPLSLNNTFYAPEETIVGNIAHPWGNGQDQWSIVSTDAWMTILAEDGGIFSTAEELALFGNALFDGQLLSQESLEQLTTFLHVGRDENYYSYSLFLWDYHILNKDLYGHDGLAPQGYQSALIYYPPTGFVMSALFTTNDVYSWEPIYKRIFSEYLKTLNISSQAQSDAVYSYTTTGELFKIVTTTLIPQKVGQTLYKDIRKIRVNPTSDELWGLSRNFVGWQLLKFNCNSGEAFPRFDLTIFADSIISCMDFSSDGTLYISTYPGGLYKVDTSTGESINVATVPCYVNSFAIHPATGEFWIESQDGSDDHIVKFNLESRDTTNIGTTELNKLLNDIAFDSQGTLLGIIKKDGTTPCRLVKINEENGAGLLIKSFDDISFIGLTSASDAVVKVVPYSSKEWLLSLYPNPTSNYLYINTGTTGRYHLELNSLNGQLVLSADYEGTINQLDLSSFQKGIYFFTIRSKDFVTTRKIIKL